MCWTHASSMAPWLPGVTPGWPALRRSKQRVRSLDNDAPQHTCSATKLPGLHFCSQSRCWQLYWLKTPFLSSSDLHPFPRSRGTRNLLVLGRSSCLLWGRVSEAAISPSQPPKVPSMKLPEQVGSVPLSWPHSLCITKQITHCYTCKYLWLGNCRRHLCILRSALEDRVAGGAYPPGLLRCGGPLHLLSAHSLGLLSCLLEKESTEMNLCDNTRIRSTLKSLVHPQAVPILAYNWKPHTFICPHSKRFTLLPFLPEVFKWQKQKEPIWQGKA